ncbi:MAG: hypothetical protein M3Q52_06465 [Pseudomonadota bacterium]|nr:hypothetical protein [Pseudomonadota bacterium]
MADLGLAMLIALPALAPAASNPRTVEAPEALSAGTAEPKTIANPDGAGGPAAKGAGF